MGVTCPICEEEFSTDTISLRAHLDWVHALTVQVYSGGDKYLCVCGLIDESTTQGVERLHAHLVADIENHVLLASVLGGGKWWKK